MNEGLLVAIVSVMSVVAVGYLARRFSIITAEAEPAILSLLVNVLVPCFVFSKIVGNDKVKIPSNVIYAPLAGFLGVAVPMLICFLVARYIIKIKPFEDKPTRRTFAVATALQNYGFVAIPVIIEVFGDGLLGIMLLHNMGVELALWSVGLMLLNGSVDKSSWKKIINGPTISVIGCLSINALGLDAHLGEVVRTPIDTIAGAFIPVGLILIGATVYGCLQSPDAGIEQWKKGMSVMIVGNIFRSGVIPLCVILLASVMPYTPELLKVVVIEAAMPAAFFPIVMARHYNGRPSVALQISLSSLVIGFAILPFWVAFGKDFLNL